MDNRKRLARIVAGIVVAFVSCAIYSVVCLFFQFWLFLYVQPEFNEQTFCNIAYPICPVAAVMTSFFLMRLLWPKTPTQ